MIKVNYTSYNIIVLINNNDKENHNIAWATTWKKHNAYFTLSNNNLKQADSLSHINASITISPKKFLNFEKSNNKINDANTSSNFSIEDWNESQPCDENMFNLPSNLNRNLKTLT